ncbi:hypothetical protein SAMN00790413_04172 [Deinococcus hopiensis KR-140]|uniref:Uncharacterized protein n=1 Tax=Deinococcus hopiensis KR-140 TaxID=695939 RepID=A0A1W1UP61_9DEIO|nr:hypothetical protein SAMN00790413_04172 [Deinococcus hopiensis KR-140]
MLRRGEISDAQRERLESLFPPLPGSERPYLEPRSSGAPCGFSERVRHGAMFLNGWANGQPRGGFSTEIYLRAEGQGKPVAFVLSGGQRHESKQRQPLLVTGAGRRAGRGRPRICSGRRFAGKGYGHTVVRKHSPACGTRMSIPGRKDQGPNICFGAAVYRERNKVERLLNSLKNFRRSATRCRKRAVGFQGWPSCSGPDWSNPTYPTPCRVFPGAACHDSGGLAHLSALRPA